MFKVNNQNKRTTSVTSSGVFTVNFEHISHHFLVFLLLTFNKKILGGKAWVCDFTKRKNLVKKLWKILFILPRTLSRYSNFWTFLVPFFIWLSYLKLQKNNSLSLWCSDVSKLEFKSTNCLIPSVVKKVCYWNFINW